MDDSPRERHAFWHSFNMYPRLRFEMQHTDEQPILVLRRHPLTQIPWIINAVIGILVVTILGFFILPNVLSVGQVFMFLFFGFCFLFSYAWVNFLIWYFTVGILTNQRILDFDFYNLIYKEFSATTIREVSDITTTIGGFFGSIFNFGLVVVKTEGFEQNIEFDNIPNPSGVVKIINELMQRSKRGAPINRTSTHGRII